MESPFEVRQPATRIYAATLADARKLHRQREEEINTQAKRDRDEELAAWCRLLNL